MWKNLPVHHRDHQARNLRELIQNLICAGLDAGLRGQVGLEGVGGEGADGVLRHLEAAAVVNVSDWKEKNKWEKRTSGRKTETDVVGFSCINQHQDIFSFILWWEQIKAFLRNKWSDFQKKQGYTTSGWIQITNLYLCPNYIPTLNWMLA